MTLRSDTGPAGHPAAVEGCLDSCRRCEIVLDAVLEQRGDVAARAFAAVGPHLRHCLDHFRCLLAGLESGRVDFDARERDARYERDPDRCRAELALIAEALRSLGPEQLDRPLEVRQAASVGRSPAVASNLERELVFLSSHTIHHIAIMGLVARSHGVAVPEELGVAFSTAAHLETLRPGSV